MTDAVDVDKIVADEPLGPGAEDSDPQEEQLMGVGGKFLAVAVLVGLLAGVAAFALRLPYLVLEPGRTFATEEYVEVEGAEEFTSPGEVHFVTIQQRRLSPIGWVISNLQAGDEIFHEDELLRGRTIDEQREQNAQLMVTSQNSAIAAALGHLGFETAEPAGAVVVDVVPGGALDGIAGLNDVISAIDGEPILTADELFEVLQGSDATSVTLRIATPGAEPEDIEVPLTSDTSGFVGIMRMPDTTDAAPGATISDVVPGGPVADLLEPGDRIVSLDGQAIDSFTGLVEALGTRRAGDEVQLVAQRPADDGSEQPVEGTIVLGTRAFERAGLVRAETQFRDADLPFDVGFTTEDIGGPSAGLAFTLTVLDVLTEGDLTGGANIVVTGAIARDGSVSPVGGLRQKAFAAEKSGADVFIVPELNVEAATTAVPELRVEGVTSLSEALEIIEEFGGNVEELPTNGEL